MLQNTVQMLISQKTVAPVNLEFSRNVDDGSRRGRRLCHGSLDLTVAYSCATACTASDLAHILRSSVFHMLSVASLACAERAHKIDLQMITDPVARRG